MPGPPSCLTSGWKYSPKWVLQTLVPMQSFLIVNKITAYPDFPGILNGLSCYLRVPLFLGTDEREWVSKLISKSGKLATWSVYHTVKSDLLQLLISKFIRVLVEEVVGSTTCPIHSLCTEVQKYEVVRWRPWDWKFIRILNQILIWISIFAWKIRILTSAPFHPYGF